MEVGRREIPADPGRERRLELATFGVTGQFEGREVHNDGRDALLFMRFSQRRLPRGRAGRVATFAAGVLSASGDRRALALEA